MAFGGVRVAQRGWMRDAGGQTDRLRGGLHRAFRGARAARQWRPGGQAARQAGRQAGIARQSVAGRQPSRAGLWREGVRAVAPQVVGATVSLTHCLSSRLAGRHAAQPSERSTTCTKPSSCSSSTTSSSRTRCAGGTTSSLPVRGGVVRRRAGSFFRIRGRRRRVLFVCRNS